MKTSFTLALSALLISTGLFAQDVQKCCGTSNSTFLLGNLNYAKHTQSLYLPGDLTNAQSGWIDRLYFRYGNTGEDLGVTLSDVMIRMALTPATGFAGGNTFFTGMDTVLMTPELTIEPGTTGGWFSFPIDPFQYDPGRTMILDIWFEGSTTTNFGTLGNSNTGRKLYAIDLSAPTGSSSSSTWQDFGFDVNQTARISSQEQESLHVVPLPGYTQWQITGAEASLQGGSIQVMDAGGRVQFTEASITNDGPYILDMGSYAAGLYILQVRARDGSLRSARIVKP